MRDEEKTREELLEELRVLRQLFRVQNPPRVAPARPRPNGRPGAGHDACGESRGGRVRPGADSPADEARRRFLAVFENALDGIVLMDHAGRYADGNPAACQLLGYTREEFLGLHAWDVTPAHQRDRLPEMMRQFVTLGVMTGDQVVVCKGGETREVEYRAVANILPGLHLVVYHDVTGRKRAERALRESENRFRAFVDKGPAVSFMKDAAGRYVYISSAYGRFMGRNPAVQLGKTDDEIWPPDVAAGLREHDRAVLESGRPLEVVEVVPAPDGSPQHWLAFKFPFQDSAGALLLGGVSVNITERVRAEAKLRALSNRLVEVQEEERRVLARELHDELGQSLTALRFTVEQLGALVGDDARPRAAEARAAIEEMLARVRDLSSDLRPPLLDHVGLAPALGSLVERYTARTGIRVGFRHTGLGRRFDLHVETAAYRIVQEALTNVGRHARVTEAAVRVWADADCLAAQIEDHGVGFDPAAVATSGRSCGLAGMAERARLLGGELAIESNPGSGTHVFARLPIRPPPDTRRGGGRGEEGPAAS